jgi:hypothetical protein
VYNLLNVAFPAMMLGCFLFADALEESPASKWREILRQPDLRYRFIKVAAFSLIMFVGLVNTVKGFPAAIGFGRELAGWLRMPPDTQVTDELRKYVGGSDTIIVARTPNAEHVKTRSYSALTDCSLPQIMLLSQLKEVQELLDRGTVRYVILFRGRPQIDTSERLSFARYHRVADVGGEAMVLERNGPALNF